MANPRSRRFTSRDVEILSGLELMPLTCRQLLKLCQTFQEPFSSLRRLQDRLKCLADSGLVSRWPYATIGNTPEYYYRISAKGFSWQHPEKPAPSKRSFSQLPMTRHAHSRYLSDFLVHTIVESKQADIRFSDFYGENTLRIPIGNDTLMPDASFQLVTATGQTLRFFVELDNSTETVRSSRDDDSWQRKIRLYDTLQDASANRFRVLVVATKSALRRDNILRTADSLYRNPERPLLLGTHLPEFLASASPLSDAVFLDHGLRPVALIAAPQIVRPSIAPRTSVPYSATSVSVPAARS